MFLSIAALYLYLRSSRRPHAQTGPARSLSTEQAQLLLREFSKHPGHSLVIKTDASDPEAKQLSQQLYEVLRSSQWQIALSTDNTGPTVGPGLYLAQTGEDLRPPYPDRSQDPYVFLPGAFASAHIDISAQTGQASGDYKLYLIVGPRGQTQLAAPRHGYILRAAARWLLRHLRALRGA